MTSRPRGRGLDRPVPLGQTLRCLLAFIQSIRNVLIFFYLVCQRGTTDYKVLNAISLLGWKLHFSGPSAVLKVNNGSRDFHEVLPLVDSKTRLRSSKTRLRSSKTRLPPPPCFSHPASSPSTSQQPRTNREKHKSCCFSKSRAVVLHVSNTLRLADSPVARVKGDGGRMTGA